MGADAQDCISVGDMITDDLTKRAMGEFLPLKAYNRIRGESEVDLIIGSDNGRTTRAKLYPRVSTVGIFILIDIVKGNAYDALPSRVFGG